MKILIISDTHKKISNAISVIERIAPTHIFHLGDMVSDAEDLKTIFPNIELKSVRGNNDFFSRSPDNLLIGLEGINFFLTHGHNYGVKESVKLLAHHAKKIGAHYALFGHTHEFFDDTIECVRLLNPSSNGYIIIEDNKIEVYKY